MNFGFMAMPVLHLPLIYSPGLQDEKADHPKSCHPSWIAL